MTLQNQVKNKSLFQIMSTKTEIVNIVVKNSFKKIRNIEETYLWMKRVNVI